MKRIRGVERKPTIGESLLCIAFMVIALVGGMVILKFPTEVCLLSAAIFTGIVAYVRVGMTFEKMQTEIISKIATVMPALLIVWCVALLVGTWCYSGTLPMMIYYGMLMISPKFLLVTAFIVTALLSVLSGASWGAAATVGVALMGITHGLNMPLAPTAAAVVGGAYFGDKLSPLSDTTNLTAAVIKVDLYDHIKYMLWTTLPATILAIFIYFIMGINNPGGSASNQSVIAFLNQLKTAFNLSWITLIPVLIVVIGSFSKMPTIPTMLTSSISAIAIGVGVQGFTFKNGLVTVINGFDPKMITAIPHDQLLPNMITLVTRGGIYSQGGFLAFITSAMCFAGIISGSGMLEVAISGIKNRIKTVRGAVAGVILSTFSVACMTGSGGLTIILPGEMMGSVFEKLRLSPLLLSRTIEDSGSLLCPIIPWAAAGVFMTGVLGVSTWEYLPYAFFNYSGMFFALFYAFTNINIKRLSPQNSTVNEEITNSISS